MPILELKNVNKTFGVTTVIDDFSAAIVEPTRGRIFFRDEDIADLDPRERNFAFVFQSYALYPHLSVRGEL
jgi:ABC-type Fe3+/spermidine/putrescine transport system ATPase subunit